MELLDLKGYISAEVLHSVVKLINKNSKFSEIYLSFIADCIRYNTLLSVGRAGTGHLGASLSIVEILTEIYFRSFNLNPQNSKNKERDIFILSKGHAAPSVYATLCAKGYFTTEKLNKLRRLDGLAGHADISTPGIEANTGSLAMGLSKAVGFAIAKKRFRLGGKVIVIVGDGELQEGQCWEALLSAASYKADNLYIIIDDNKVQTDKYTEDIVTYHGIIPTLKSLGYFVSKTKGNNIKSIHSALIKLKEKKGGPKILYCETKKGQGVSFMEHPSVLKKTNDRYVWHNKAPNVDHLQIAFKEIIKRQKEVLKKLDTHWDIKNSLQYIPLRPLQIGIKGKSLVQGFADGLLDFAKSHKYYVALDGDLEEDCGYIPFHEKYPQRFFEIGIMEQHMVSVASAMSRLGYIPIVSTYAAFLTSRANEHIYNLATENGTAVFVGNMSGVIPATPGKSHQAFRDISCMKNIPTLAMYQPITAADTKRVFEHYLQGKLGKLLYLRLSLAPSRVPLPTPSKDLKVGKSQVLRTGKDILIVGIGPVVLGECMDAAVKLKSTGIDIEVWNHPWIINFDTAQLREASKRKIPLLILEDHFILGGMGESLLSFCQKESIQFSKVIHKGLTSFPQTGFRDEILEYLGLSSEVIQKDIKGLLS